MTNRIPHPWPLSHGERGITLAIASGNAGKIREMGELLSDLGCVVLGIRDVLPVPPVVVEDGVTFVENARKKVACLPTLSNVIWVSDDSGLSVVSLGGRPGVFSARYGGPGVSSKDQCRLLLSELGDAVDRRAFYSCALAMHFPDGTVDVVDGEWHGTIACDMRGQNGFGYDPIFIPEGDVRTCGEMVASEKNARSHRHVAMGAARERILRFLGRVG